MTRVGGAGHLLRALACYAAFLATPGPHVVQPRHSFLAKTSRSAGKDARSNNLQNTTWFSSASVLKSFDGPAKSKTSLRRKNACRRSCVCYSKFIMRDFTADALARLFQDPRRVQCQITFIHAARLPAPQRMWKRSERVCWRRERTIRTKSTRPLISTK